MIGEIAIAQELRDGHHVMWVDLEDPDPTTIVERLRLLDVDDKVIADQLHYYAPREPFSDAAVDLLVADVTDHAITVVVIDSTGEAFGLEGIDENKDAEVGPWLRGVARALADTGAAVVLIDHATKAADNPLHPSGSKRKRAAITGASYLLEAPVPLTREDGGRLKLTCAKDRHGNYRRGAVAATIEFTVYPDDGVTVHVWPPAVDERPAGETELRRLAHAAVQAAKNAGRPLSQRELDTLMTVKASHADKRAGIDAAIADGAIRVEQGARRALNHTYVHDLCEESEQ
jgi:hypothetical protein